MKRIFSVVSLLRHKLKIAISFLIKRNKKRVVIVATPTHGNLGDQAIVYAEKQMLKSILPHHSIIEIENGAFLKCKEFFKKRVRKTDVIVVDGGGNLGTIWGWEDDKIADIISTFSQNKVIVFPQTAYYDQSDSAKERIKKNIEIYSLAKDLTILLRDKMSFDFFAQNFPNVNIKLCPDIVLSLDRKHEDKRNGVLLCLRSDREKVVNEKEMLEIERYLGEQKIEYSFTDTVIDKRVISRNRARHLEKKWKEFSKSELIITDRLHAMIFSYITSTPCIAINNSSKKVEGSFQFIKDCGFVKMANSLADANKIIPMMKKTDNATNDFAYPIDILEGILKNGESEQKSN